MTDPLNEPVALLPCPFCGVKGEELGLMCDREEGADNSGPSRRIQCYGCHIEAPFYDTQEEAIAAWNRRVPAPADVAWVGEPPFAEGGYGDLMCKAGEEYIAEYAFGNDDGPDHEPTEFEREMLLDMFNGLMSEESFFGIVRRLAALAATASDREAEAQGAGEVVAWRRRVLKSGTGPGREWVLYGRDDGDFYAKATDRYEIQPLYAAPVHSAPQAGVVKLTDAEHKIIDSLPFKTAMHVYRALVAYRETPLPVAPGGSGDE